MWPELYQALQRNMCTQVWAQFLLPRDFFQSTKDKEFTRNHKPGNLLRYIYKKRLVRIILALLILILFIGFHTNYRDRYSLFLLLIGDYDSDSENM